MLLSKVFVSCLRKTAACPLPLRHRAPLLHENISKSHIVALGDIILYYDDHGNCSVFWLSPTWTITALRLGKVPNPPLKIVPNRDTNHCLTVCCFLDLCSAI